MSLLASLQLSSDGKHLQRKLAQGLQHQKTRLLCLLLALVDEAVIQQRGERVQDVWAGCACPLAKRLGSLHGPAAHKDRELKAGEVAARPVHEEGHGRRLG